MCMGKKGCTVSMVAKVLVLIGAINWGLVGAGWLFGGKDWNVVNMIVGGSTTIGGIIYLLVGLAGLSMIIGCKCKMCKGACADGMCAPKDGMAKPM